MKKKQKTEKGSQYIANIIRYKLQDDGVNPCDDESLDEFEKWANNMISQAFKDLGLKNPDVKLLNG